MPATLPALRTLCLSIFLAGLSATAQAQWLVSDQEAAVDRAAPEPLGMKSLPAPNAPRINLVAPALTGNATVSSPTRILVRFEPTQPATINPDSFRVKYGSLKLDITSRITAASKVTAEGIDVSEARLPKGTHRLQIEIEDSLGRVGERLVQFVIE